MGTRIGYNHPMSEQQPDNIILRKLQDMRAEIAARDEKMTAQMGVLAQGLNSVRTELKEIRVDIKRMADHIGELAMAIDHHTSRLDGSPLVYNNADPYLPDLLVCHPLLQPRVREILDRWLDS
jgi:hypothetical protein